MNVGIGYGNTEDAYDLGRLVAAAALQDGAITAPDLLLAFISSQTDAQAFYQGLREVVGADTPIIGGSAIGVITNGQLSYEGWPAAVAAFRLSDGAIPYATAAAIDEGEYAAGQQGIPGTMVFRWIPVDVWRARVWRNNILWLFE